MSKYPNLDKYVAKKGMKIKAKEKKKIKDLTEKERDALIDQMLQDLGYVE